MWGHTGTETQEEHEIYADVVCVHGVHGQARKSREFYADVVCQCVWMCVGAHRHRNHGAFWSDMLPAMLAVYALFAALGEPPSGTEGVGLTPVCKLCCEHKPGKCKMQC